MADSILTVSDLSCEAGGKTVLHGLNLHIERMRWRLHGRVNSRSDRYIPYREAKDSEYVWLWPWRKSRNCCS